MDQEDDEMDRTKKYLATLRSLHLFGCHHCHCMFVSFNTYVKHCCGEEKREFSLMTTLLACKSCGYSMSIDGSDSGEVSKKQIGMLKTLSETHNCSKLLLLKIMASDGESMVEKWDIQFCAVISPKMRDQCCGKRFETVREYRRHLYDHLSNHGKMAAFLKMADVNARYNENPQKLLTSKNKLRNQQSRDSLFPQLEIPRFLLVDVLLRNRALDLSDFMVPFELSLKPTEQFVGNTTDRIRTCQMCHTVCVGEGATPLHSEECNQNYGVPKTQMHTLVHRESLPYSSIACLLCSEDACSVSGYKTHMILNHCRVPPWSFSLDALSLEDLQDAPVESDEPSSSSDSKTSPEVASDSRTSSDALQMDVEELPSPMSSVSSQKKSDSPFPSNEPSNTDNRDASPFSPEPHQAVPDIALQPSDELETAAKASSAEASGASSSPLQSNGAASIDSSSSKAHSEGSVSPSYSVNSLRGLGGSSGSTYSDLSPLSSEVSPQSATNGSLVEVLSDDIHMTPDSPMSDALVMDVDDVSESPVAAPVAPVFTSNDSVISASPHSDELLMHHDAPPLSIGPSLASTDASKKASMVHEDNGVCTFRSEASSAVTIAMSSTSEAPPAASSPRPTASGTSPTSSRTPSPPDADFDSKTGNSKTSTPLSVVSAFCSLFPEDDSPPPSKKRKEASSNLSSAPNTTTSGTTPTAPSEPHLTPVVPPFTAVPHPDVLSISDVLAAVRDVTFSTEEVVPSASQKRPSLAVSDDAMDISPFCSPNTTSTNVPAPPATPSLDLDYGNTSNLNDDITVHQNDVNFCSDHEKCRVLVVGNLTETMSNNPDRRAEGDFEIVKELLCTLGVMIDPEATQRIGSFAPLRRRLVQVLLPSQRLCEKAIENIPNLSYSEKFRCVQVKPLLSEEERKRLYFSGPFRHPRPYWRGVPPYNPLCPPPFPQIPRIFFPPAPPPNPRAIYYPPRRY